MNQILIVEDDLVLAAGLCRALSTKENRTVSCGSSSLYRNSSAKKENKKIWKKMVPFFYGKGKSWQESEKNSDHSSFVGAGAGSFESDSDLYQWI